jgi:hypothetical protein
MKLYFLLFLLSLSLVQASNISSTDYLKPAVSHERLVYPVMWILVLTTVLTLLPVILVPPQPRW